MKKTFLALFAVIATASFTQASEVQAHVSLQYTLTPARVEFIAQRLGTVVQEEIARSLATPTPASEVADANTKMQPHSKFALAKDAKSNVLPSNKNS